MTQKILHQLTMKTFEIKIRKATITVNTFETTHTKQYI